jgi:acetyl esterase/lipase
MKHPRLRRLLFVAIALVLVSPPVRVTGEALLLLPSVMGSTVRPLDWLTDSPRHEIVAYMGADAAQRADLWTPPGSGKRHRVGAVLLVFGVNHKGRSHPAVQRVAAAIARTGVAVMVPDSALLRTGRLDRGEIDGVVRAFEFLSDRNEVDSTRVGMFGFSAGGSLALLAAADRRIASEVKYVNAFGAFADTRSYLASLAAHAYEIDGQAIEWRPADLAIEGYPRLVLDEVPNRQDRSLLADAYEKVMLAGTRPTGNPALASQLGWQATCIYRLITADNLRAAREAIDTMPPETSGLLDDVSPISHLDGLRAPVYLMHAVDDNYVPYVESRKLANALHARGLLVMHNEFRVFEHVQAADLDPLSAAPELWKLLWHLQAVMLETA